MRCISILSYLPTFIPSPCTATDGTATANMGAVAAPTVTLVGQAPASATNSAAQLLQQQQLQSLLQLMGNGAQSQVLGMLPLQQQLRTMQLLQLCNGGGFGGFNNLMTPFAMMGLSNPLSMPAQSAPVIINNSICASGNGCACNQHSILNLMNGIQ